MQPTKELIDSFQHAKNIAEDNQQAVVDVGHLWLAYLLDHKDVREKYAEISQNPEFLEKYAKGSIDRLDPDLVSTHEFLDTPVTDDLYNILKRADQLADLLGDGTLSIDMTLIAIMDEETPVSNYLSKKGITKADVIYIVEKSRNTKASTQNSRRRYSGSSLIREAANRQEELKGQTVTSKDVTSALTHDLSDYGTDLTDLAAQGLLSPVIGRHKELQDMVRILSRRTKNNPLLIGDPGVGKTSIVEALAQRIVAEDVPDFLKGKRIFSLDMASILAGASYRGEFEQRLKDILDQVRASQGEIILFIDEIHTIIGAGQSSGGMDAGNILKPMLARGEIRTIGSTTVDEYRKIFEKDKALDRRFQRILVEEPSPKESLTILRGLKGTFENHHGVLISDEALQAAVDLSERYITDRQLPDKAIDLLDEAAALQHVQQEYTPHQLDDLAQEVDQILMEIQSLDESRSQTGQDLREDLEDKQEELAVLEEDWSLEKTLIQDYLQTRQYTTEALHNLDQARASYDAEAIQRLEEEVANLQLALETKEAALEKLTAEGNRLLATEVTPEAIAEIVARQTGIPVSKLVEEDRQKLLTLSDRLGQRIIGQDEPVQVVTDTILRSYANIQDPDQPLGSFLFLGPTGVGKTELAKAVAQELFDSEEAMVRIDMSEYMEKHSVSRLVGAPPGYVGYDEGGLLTEAVRRNPYSLVLLDEVEKAHPDVFNILLQVLDDGRLTDSLGRTVDFRNTILIMTSNIGSNYLLDEIQEDGTIKEETRDHVLQQLRSHFRPEFLNRIDEILIFSPLSQETVRRIVKKELDQLGGRLGHQDISFAYSEDVVTWITQEAYDPAFGARPIQRFITKHVETPLSRALIQGKVDLETGVHLTIEEDKIKIQ